MAKSPMNTKRWIDFIVQELETSLALFYSYKQFLRLLSNRECVFLINENPEFWMLHNGTVQTTLFLYLGRIVDDSNDAKSFANFKKHCTSHVSDFSHKEFLSRKPNILQVNPKFMDGRTEPALPEFKVLFKLASEHDKYLRATCKTIRNKVFAHAILTDELQYQDLFKQVKIDRIESALLTYWSISQHIWQCYNNARSLKYVQLSYPEKIEIEKNILRAIGFSSNKKLHATSCAGE